MRIKSLTKRIKQFFEKNWQVTAICTLSAILIAELFIFIPAAKGLSVETMSDWGLSFRREGQPPTANVSATELKKSNAYYIGTDKESKIIYLTFDAGYESGYTADILDILKECDVKAAFFLVGHYLKSQPDLVKRMYNEGHIIGNHTMSHPDMSTISSIENFRAELEAVEQLYYDITGEKMLKLYRPPQGKFSSDNLSQAQLLGYKTVFWSLAYVDWNEKNQPDEKQSLDRLNSRIHNGAVVLLHLNSSTNRSILKQLITDWKEMGYTFETVDKIS